MRDVILSLNRVFLGASESIELGVIGRADLLDLLLESESLSIVDRRLSLKLLISQKIDAVNSRAIKQVLAELVDDGWKVRFTSNDISASCIVVDHKIAYTGNFGEYSQPPNAEEPIFQIIHPDGVEVISEYFESLWESSEHRIQIHENLIQGFIPSVQEGIVTFSEQKWRTILTNPALSQEHLLQLTPRQFEELIAELLYQEGMKVELTPETRDGGKDIIAYSPSRFGELQYYVECKRNSPQRKVGVEIVRNLYGVIESDRVTAGIVVTTSDFSQPAQEFQRLNEKRLFLQNGSELMDWIRKVKSHT